MDWDLFSATLASRMKSPFQVRDALARAKDQITLDEVEKQGGARRVQRLEFHAERVAALAAAKIPEACALLAGWQKTR